MSDQEMLNFGRAMQAQGWNACAQYTATINPPQTLFDTALKATGAVAMGAIAGVVTVGVVTSVYKMFTE